MFRFSNVGGVSIAQMTSSNDILPTATKGRPEECPPCVFLIFLFPLFSVFFFFVQKMLVTFTHKRQKLASLNRMPQSINSVTCEDPPTVLLYRDRNKAAAGEVAWCVAAWTL